MYIQQGLGSWFEHESSQKTTWSFPLSAAHVQSIYLLVKFHSRSTNILVLGLNMDTASATFSFTLLKSYWGPDKWKCFPEFSQSRDFCSRFRAVFPSPFQALDNQGCQRCPVWSPGLFFSPQKDSKRKFYPTHVNNYLVRDGWIWVGRLDRMPDLLAAKFRGCQSYFLRQIPLRTLYITENPAPALSPMEQWRIPALHNQKIQFCQFIHFTNLCLDVAPQSMSIFCANASQKSHMQKWIEAFCFSISFYSSCTHWGWKGFAKPCNSKLFQTDTQENMPLESYRGFWTSSRWQDR